MYTETRNNFSIRDLVLQFLFVALFIFILIWLFPMKSDLKDAVASANNSNTDLSVIYDKIFNENILAMKESAQSYFTTSRLPQKVGDKVKITLGDMLDKKIILPFGDKDGKQCDLDESYVEITKKDDEFVMKVNLKCGEEENYLIVYMGCYDYCKETLCEKKTSVAKIYSAKTKKIVAIKKPNKTTIVINNTNTNTNTVIVTPQQPVVPTNPTYSYLYEYQKISDGSSNFTSWSDWSTTPVTPTDTREVNTKTETETVIAGYNTKEIVDKTKKIFEVIQVPIGYKNVTSCILYNVSSTITGYSESYIGMQKFSSLQNSTATIRYELVGTYNWYCEGTCTAGKTFVYRVYQKTPITSTGYSCARYSTITTVILGNQTILTGYGTSTVSEPYYRDVNTTYYSYRTRITAPGTIDLKWSTYNDTSLLNSGYNYTGNSKMIQTK